MLRPCLIVINIISLAGACALTGLGAWILHSGTSVFRFIAADKTLKPDVPIEALADVADKKGHLRTVAILATVIGAVAMAVAMTGIVALLKKSTLFSSIYKLSLLLMLIAHVAGSAYIIIRRSALEKELHSSMTANQQAHFVARTKGFNATKKVAQSVTQLFERMHIYLECCGVEKPGDISNSSSFLRSIKKDPDFEAVLPESCCKIKNKPDALAGKKLKLVDEDCPKTLNSPSRHKQACFKQVKSLINKMVLPVIITCGVFAVILASALGMMVAQMTGGIDDSDDDWDVSSSSTD